MQIRGTHAAYSIRRKSQTQQSGLGQQKTVKGHTLLEAEQKHVHLCTRYSLKAVEHAEVEQKSHARAATRADKGGGGGEDGCVCVYCTCVCLRLCPVLLISWDNTCEKNRHMCEK